MQQALMRTRTRTASRTPCASSWERRPALPLRRPDRPVRRTAPTGTTSRSRWSTARRADLGRDLNWINDTFPATETLPPGTASFDTTAALVKTGLNIAPSRRPEPPSLRRAGRPIVSAARGRSAWTWCSASCPGPVTTSPSAGRHRHDRTPDQRGRHQGRRMFWDRCDARRLRQPDRCRAPSQRPGG